MSLVPAMCLVRIGPATILKAPSASASSSHLRAQNLLTAGQVAFCTVLLICACLIAESLAKVLAANQALLSDTVLTTEIEPPPDPYSDWIKRQQLLTRLTSQAASLSGVIAAGISSALPSTGETWVSKVSFKEYPMPAGRQFQANFRFVTPGYTRALGLSLIAGRHMSERDLNRPVVLISRSLAEQLPADAHIVGSHFNFFDSHGGPNKPLQVVGIVEDVRATADKPAPPTIYVPDWEWPPWGSALVVRTNGNPGAVAEALRATIRRADPRLALSEVRTIRSVFNGATASRRYVSELAMGFALSATLLAVLGVYGLRALQPHNEPVRSAFAWRWEQDRRTYSPCFSANQSRGHCRELPGACCLRLHSVVCWRQVSTRDAHEIRSSLPLSLARWLRPPCLPAACQRDVHYAWTL